MLALLGPFQTSNFTCAESNANELKHFFFRICISFCTCEDRRLKRVLLLLALNYFFPVLCYLKSVLILANQDGVIFMHTINTVMFSFK